jgi:TolB-like protein/DNA-binding winged helix-turn-helix (wHTH) protein
MLEQQQFGRIEVRPAERAVLFDGEPVQIGTRAFDVLMMLIEHRERVVTQEELLDKVWSGLVVENNNLQVQISALRKAIGAGSIATIPGRGYQFVAVANTATVSSAIEVTANVEAPDAAQGAAVPMVGARDHGSRAALATALILIVTSVVAATWVWPPWQRAPTATAPAVPEARAAQKSVAILAFESLSDDESNRYFADGVSDELITLLSRVHGLRVTGRHSAFQFREKTVSMAEIARRLDVTHLIAGSVRRSGERVRIAAQLIEGASGTVLGSESFDREVKDVLAVQAELALKIAARLQLSLNASTLAGSGTTHIEAWQLFLQGERMPLGQRVAFYQRALAIDPKFARVHVALAMEVFRDANRQPTPANPHDVFARATAHANEALRLDPESSDAYVMLAYADGWIDDREAFARHTRRVVELNPNNPDGSELATALYLEDGRMDEALIESRRVVELDPLHHIPYSNLAGVLRMANQPELALVQIDRSLILAPDDVRVSNVKARILLDLGRTAEALVLARQASTRHSKYTPLEVDVFARAAPLAELTAIERRPDLPARSRARLALLRGNVDSYMNWLEQEPVSKNAYWVLFDPEVDVVRGSPRFKSWLERHQLTQAHERAQAWRAANPSIPRGSKR